MAHEPTEAQIGRAQLQFSTGIAAREQTSSTLKALAAWAGAITGILGITSVLGLSFDAGSITSLSHDDQKTVVDTGLAALLFAILGTAIATVANGVWNEPPSVELLAEAETTKIRSHFSSQTTWKQVALGLSILAIVLAVLSASWAIKTAVLADPAPITEGNRLMAVEEGDEQITKCGVLIIDDDGQILFRAANSQENLPVPDIEAATKTGDCS
ncbi:MAG: hypothetical protein KF883_02860 [Thermomicrobiales bacterium]|nr:hypothetical protein [Thermomicrobiales bacterium]